MFTQSLFRSVSPKCRPTPALLISNVWKWASGLYSTSGCLISYPQSQTIKSKNSKGFAPVLFQELHFVWSYFDRDQHTGLAFTAVTVDIPLEMGPNLIISILSDFFSLTITGCDFQGWPSPLQAPWCLIQGQGRLARHSAQTLAPFPQSTMHSSSLLWGLEEITQPGE